MGAHLKRRLWLINCIIGLGYVAGLNDACAQEKVRYGFDIGVIGSFFDQKTAPYPLPELVEEFKRDARVSMEVGGTVNYSVTDILSLSSGLKYSEKGGSYKTKNPDVAYYNQSGSKTNNAYNFLRYRLVYLEVPVLAKLRILNREAKDSNLKICGGFSGMVNIGSKFRYNVYEGPADDLEEEWKSEKLDIANDFVLGWTAGAEWNEGPLILYLRYTKTISPIYDSAKPGYENFDVNMSTISLGLGVLLD